MSFPLDPAQREAVEADRSVIATSAGLTNRPPAAIIPPRADLSHSLRARNKCR
jgi:hypothetical protein